MCVCVMFHHTNEDKLLIGVRQITDVRRNICRLQSQAFVFSIKLHQQPTIQPFHSYKTKPPNSKDYGLLQNVLALPNIHTELQVHPHGTMNVRPSIKL